MTIGEAITIRAAFGSVKRQLAEAGFDIKDVRKFSDLAPILAGMLTEDVVEQAAEVLENKDALEALLGLFSTAVKNGVLAGFFRIPGDQVEQEDEGNA